MNADNPGNGTAEDGAPPEEERPADPNPRLPTGDEINEALDYLGEIAEALQTLAGIAQTVVQMAASKTAAPVSSSPIKPRRG